MNKLSEFELNKIYCMDCIEGMKKLPDESISLIVTSPPYNIGIDYGLYEDNKEWEEYKKFLLNCFKEMFRIIKQKGIVSIVIGNQRNSGLPHYVYFLLQESGFKIIKEIFWYKGLYYIQGETIFVCSKDGDYNKYYKKNDGFYANSQFSTIWEIRYKGKENRTELNHDAFFLKQIPSNFIKISTKEGDIVLDCFMGSGTTALACKELKRDFIGFEINPEYIKNSNKRLSQQILL